MLLHPVEHPGHWLGPLLASFSVARIETTLSISGRQVTIEDVIYQGQDGEVLEKIEDRLMAMTVEDGSDLSMTFLDLLQEHVLCEDAVEHGERHGYGSVWMVYAVNRAGMEVEMSTFSQDEDEEPDPEDEFEEDADEVDDPDPGDADDCAL